MKFKGKHITVEQLEQDRFFYRDSLTQTRKKKDELVQFLHEESARLATHLDEIGRCLADLRSTRTPASPAVKKIPFGFGVTNIPMPKLTDEEKEKLATLNDSLPDDDVEAPTKKAKARVPPKLHPSRTKKTPKRRR